MNLEALEYLRPDDDFERFATKHGCTLESGCSKYAFVPKDKNDDFVIKFSTNPHCCLEDDECEREAQMYETAKEYRIEKIFLKTELLTVNQHGMRFYIQPKYSETVCDMNQGTKKRINKITKTVTRSRNGIVSKCLDGMYTDISSYWLSAVISLYGKRFVRSFEQWSQKYEINDLHNGNIGYKNGKPVIFDYCGFYG